jgi:hypothetical protein
MAELLIPTDEIISYIYDQLKDSEEYTICDNIEIDSVDCNIKIVQRHNIVIVCIYLNNIYKNDEYDDISIYCKSKQEYNKENILYLIENLQNIIKNKKDYIISGNKLLLKTDYEMKMKLNKMFISELNKCWICLDECLTNERLLCGHNIHTRCAEILVKNNKKKKIERIKCGCCMRKYYPAFYEVSNEYDDESEN